MKVNRMAKWSLLKEETKQQIQTSPRRESIGLVKFFKSNSSFHCIQHPDHWRFQRFVLLYFSFISLLRFTFLLTERYEDCIIFACSFNIWIDLFVRTLTIVTSVWFAFVFVFVVFRATAQFSFTYIHTYLYWTLCFVSFDFACVH